LFGCDDYPDIVVLAAAERAAAVASLSNLYRRGHIFWWQRVHRLFGNRIIRIRLSLATGDRREAKDRSATLASNRRMVTTMLNGRIRATDDRITEAELQVIGKAAYGQMLARICEDQRRTPHHFDEHSLGNNITSADYYNRLIENGGHIALFPGEEQLLRLRGWSLNRIAGLSEFINLVLTGTEPIKNYNIDHHLRELGFKPGEGRRRQVRRALYPFYRDACLDAERSLRSAAFSSGRITSQYDIDSVPTATVSPVSTIVEPSPPMSGIMQLAINGLVADETWGAKSGRQLRSMVALFELLVGKRPFALLVQADLSSFKRKLRFVPQRYSMSDAASRASVLATVAAAEANEKGNQGKFIYWAKSGRIGLKAMSSMAGSVITSMA
jgi:hypothetical protein